jgi:Ca2+-binding EF-hand superfamily protein
MEVQDVGLNNDIFTKFQTPLTEDQKNKLEEILAKYDPANLTEADKKSLMDELKNSGIPRCKETFQMLKDAGFKLGHGGGQPDGMQVGADGQQNSELLTLIQQLESGQITEEEFRALIGEMVQGDSVPTGSVINESV